MLKSDGGLIVKREKEWSEMFLCWGSSHFNRDFNGQSVQLSHSEGERVCTNLAHSLLPCSSVAVHVMELTAGLHFFKHCLLVCFLSLLFVAVPLSPSLSASPSSSLCRIKAACFSFGVSQKASRSIKPLANTVDCTRYGRSPRAVTHRRLNNGCEAQSGLRLRSNV